MAREVAKAEWWRGKPVCYLAPVEDSPTLGHVALSAGLALQDDPAKVHFQAI